ncbi:DUF4304 domain-containing protein [Adhaeribacter rhizoryzae]|uniref:DUF4304 domain-containing protein n=1 Tax=Adhaeribacter rhizoryzae TaxID=2607907 RepID=A0A5M6DPX4_9BACT|nr:DUF4304 domain-containing protein [Adhaeribacter rhizoryzae]KAA5548269.1 DUF4304 domain-containing protein [Adhaeribacter rhizoryzae]
MDNKQFKNIFNKVAKANGFKYVYSAWFKESEDSILVLSLQKSNFSNFYYLNIKTYIKDIFGQSHSISKELVRDIGDIFRREPKEFENLFNLESKLSELEREKEINNLFSSFLENYSNIMLEKRLIIAEYQILPPVKEEIMNSLE